MVAKKILEHDVCWVKQDADIVDALFWEFDAARCSSRRTSERDEFIRIVMKYGDYIASELLANPDK